MNLMQLLDQEGTLPEKEKCPIVLLVGQSNMADRGFIVKRSQESGQEIGGELFADGHAKVKKDDSAETIDRLYREVGPLSPHFMRRLQLASPS